MNCFFGILQKDLRSEFRSGVQIFPLLTLSILLSTFLGLGVTESIGDREQLIALFHPLVWGIFLVSGAVNIMRTFESDREAQTLRALFLFQRSLVEFYLAKVSFIFLLCLGNHLISTLFLAALLDIPLWEWMSSYLILSIVVTFAYSALAALIGGVMIQQAHRAVLFPLTFLPLLFPLFFAVAEISTSLSAGTGVLGAGNWFSLVIALGTLYLVGGVTLFESAARE
ncbi:heme exporter protein CcmB [bacterium]|nr:heme exporter protein CcmB [bacterium]